MVGWLLAHVPRHWFRHVPFPFFAVAFSPPRWYPDHFGLCDPKSQFVPPPNFRSVSFIPPAGGPPSCSQLKIPLISSGSSISLSFPPSKPPGSQSSSSFLEIVNSMIRLPLPFSCWTIFNFLIHKVRRHPSSTPISPCNPLYCFVSSS